MEEVSPKPHSFVVKVWAEEVVDARRDPSWRGYITHVGTGERLYLKSLLQVPGFMAPFVEDLGGSLDVRTRMCLWMAPPASRHRSAPSGRS